ncbi:UNVERIFIED_CONTAM: hypothetical protein FKN15_009056 [Acipenser sinensis]
MGAQGPMTVTGTVTGKKCEAFQAGEGHYGPQGPDGPGPRTLGKTGTSGPGLCPGPAAAPIAIPPSPRGVQGGWEEASQLAQEDMLSISASREGASFFSDMQVGVPPAEEEPGFEVALEASAPLLSSSVSALMGRAAAFLQVPWMTVAEPHRSMFQTQAMAPHPQKFPAFPDFMEETVAMELRLLSSTLLQISGLQGQALGRSLASLIVARRQLWLSQVRVPDVYKATLLDAPITPGVEEILQRSHRERCSLPALLHGAQTRTVTRTVPVPTALLGDLRHRLQGTPAGNNRAQLAGREKAERGQSTHQCHRRRFQGQRPKQPPETALPQPQQPEQGP